MAERQRTASIQQLLVDTGSEYTWLPSQVLADSGVRIEKPSQHFVMANGEVITRDLGYAILKVNGFETVDEIVFGHQSDLNLLGARTLEGFGAVIDATKKQLVASGPHLAAQSRRK
ncbi:MAG TPA: hypothetical protein VJT71_10200 [Pyrinomonadaceae bacterium]|nr:hypothetical protein [Pyrinomonadaceae bacterium]